MNDTMLQWHEDGVPHTAPWQSAAGVAAPRKVVVADDRMKADMAYRLACEGTALLWRGDFQNARQLLQAMARRIDRRARKDVPPAEKFNARRLAQSQRARTLGMLLLPFQADYHIPLRRAPDVARACQEAYGPAAGPFVASLRELLGIIGAHEWRKKGVWVPALDAHVHPHYGVFAPVRGEYIELLAQAPLPPARRAFDIGTGTGVVAALLARRGIAHVVATDINPRALACARENINRLGLGERVEVVEADLFPTGQERADLIVCNPPWVPARPSSALEYAVYDADSRMLRGFLAGARAHLEPGGQAWLVLSDIAEHLGLRTRDFLLEEVDKAGLRVLERHDIKPAHPRSLDASDPLHEARAAETTSLWRLAAAP